MTKVKRKIDAYFFGIEQDESVDWTDQSYFYGAITVMGAITTFIAYCVY